MSLGPPFDESGARVQLGTGAAAVLLLMAAVGVALLSSDRTLGKAFTVRILFSNPGALRTGAHVRMAGHQIGEVVAIRGRNWMGTPTPGQPRVEVELRVLQSYRRYLYKNATFFAATPNVLTEAVLEVGPPPGGVAPERAVEDGETVRGADPPEIDLFLKTINENLTVLMMVAHELRPEWNDFRGAMSQLMLTTSGLAEAGQLAGIWIKGGRALRAGRELKAALDESQAPPRVRALVKDLSAALDELGPDLQRLGAQMGVVQDQLSGLTTTFGPRQRRQLLDGVAEFRRVIELGQKMSDDLRWLLSYTERGNGTIGGFLNDIQIFDELKETHRIIKHQSWRLFMKGKDPGQRQLR